MEILSVRDNDGFPAEAFLLRLRTWTAQWLSAGRPRLNLKEVDLSRLGLPYWHNSGVTFVKSAKMLLDSVTKESVVVTPAPCDECKISVAQFDGPIACSRCNRSLTPVCVFCKAELYDYCSRCVDLGNPTFSCIACTENCRKCSRVLCSECGEGDRDICIECLKYEEDIIDLHQEEAGMMFDYGGYDMDDYGQDEELDYIYDSDDSDYYRSGIKLSVFEYWLDMQ